MRYITLTDFYIYLSAAVFGWVLGNILEHRPLSGVDMAGLIAFSITAIGTALASKKSDKDFP